MKALLGLVSGKGLTIAVFLVLGLAGTLATVSYFYTGEIKSHAETKLRYESLEESHLELIIKLGVERRINERLAEVDQVIVADREYADVILKETQDEMGNYDKSAVRSLLCKKGLADSTLCGVEDPSRTTE